MRRLGYLLISVLTVSCGNKRTQEPKEPISYHSAEVSFESLKADITLSGTLTTPKGDTAQKAVLLITGSGPQDRDYSNKFEHKPFLVLADYLTQRGIAVLRYDERGVGESEGDYRKATYDDLVSDAAGGITFLRQRGFNKVGIIGHSQGGGIAPLASQNAQADFIVSMAGVSTTADKVLLYNTRYRLQKMGIVGNVREEIISTIDSLLRIHKQEPNTRIAKVKMEQFINQRESKASAQYKEVAEKLGDSRRLIEGWLDPKFIYSLHNDPLQTLKKIRIPILVLYGNDDGTIDIDRMQPEIQNALDSTDHEIIIFDDLGHLFMNTKDVPIHKLKEVEETIAPEVLESIYIWIDHL